MLLVLVFALVVARARLGRTEILLIAWAGSLALRWGRNVPVFAIVVTPILARHLTLWLREVRNSNLLNRYRRICDNVSEIDARADGRWLVAGVLVILILVMAKPRVVGGQPDPGHGITDESISGGRRAISAGEPCGGAW